MFKEPVFYVPGLPGIIDLAVTREGVLTGGYSGETLEQMRARHPGAEIGELETVAIASEEMFRSAPKEITEERYTDMLEVLPPVGWITRGGESSFKLSERTSGSITAIFARVDSRHFEMSDRITMKHDDIVAAVRKAIGSQS